MKKTTESTNHDSNNACLKKISLLFRKIFYVGAYYTKCTFALIFLKIIYLLIYNFFKLKLTNFKFEHL